MIHSESFEEQYLLGRTEEEVTDVVRDLEYVLAGLKGALEYNGLDIDVDEWYVMSEAARLQSMDPTCFLEQIQCEECKEMLTGLETIAGTQERVTTVRVCLELAYCRLAEMNPGAEVSKREHADRAFNERLQHLRSIRFRRGGFRTKGFESVIKLQGDAITYFWGMMQFGMLSDEEEPDDGDLSMSRDELLSKLGGFHLGEWDGTYVDVFAEEGEQWSVTLFFDDSSESVEIKGEDMFPWNFEAVSEFMNGVQ